MRILSRSGCPKPEVLLAYEDHALDPDEQVVVAAHLRVCDRCYERLVLSHEIGVLVRRSVPPLVDDPEGLEELKRRLRVPPTPLTICRQRTNAGRIVALGVALTMLLGVGLVSTETIEGGSRFSRWFSGDVPAGQTRPDGTVSGTPLVASSVVTGVPELPFGLLPTTDEPGPAGDRFYRSANGLAISVIVERENDSAIYADSGANTTEIVGSNGLEVYVSVNDTPEGSGVVAFAWVESGRLVSVLVIEQPDTGLTVDAAVQIAAALMAVAPD